MCRTLTFAMAIGRSLSIVYKGGRLHLKVGVQTGSAEVAQNYNFYAPPAGLRKQLTIMRVYCENPACQPMAQTLYQLLARFKR